MVINKSRRHFDIAGITAMFEDERTESGVAVGISLTITSAKLVDAKYYFGDRQMYVPGVSHIVTGSDIAGMFAEIQLKYSHSDVRVRGAQVRTLIDRLIYLQKILSLNAVQGNEGVLIASDISNICDFTLRDYFLDGVLHTEKNFVKITDSLRVCAQAATFSFSSDMYVMVYGEEPIRLKDGSIDLEDAVISLLEKDKPYAAQAKKSNLFTQLRQKIFPSKPNPPTVKKSMSDLLLRVEKSVEILKNDLYFNGATYNERVSFFSEMESIIGSIAPPLKSAFLGTVLKINNRSVEEFRQENFLVPNFPLVFEDLISFYKNPRPNIAVDIASEAKIITLTDASIFYGDKCMFIPGESYIVSVQKARDLGVKSSLLEGIVVLSRLNPATKISAYQLDGIYHSNIPFSGIPPGVEVHALAASFAFVSDHYASVTDEHGRESRLKDGNISLQNATLNVSPREATLSTSFVGTVCQEKSKDLLENVRNYLRITKPLYHED